MKDVAEIHQTTLVPSKDELLQQWLPRQPWFDGDPEQLVRVGSYRFLDPAGHVGIETLLMNDGRTTWHVPLTYRGEPVAGPELVGTTEHGVLGRRFVHYGPTDPVYIQQATDAIINAGHQALLPEGSEITATAQGSGITAPPEDVRLAVAVRTDEPAQGAGVLTVSWGFPKQPQHAALVALHAEPV